MTTRRSPTLRLLWVAVLVTVAILATLADASPSSAQADPTQAPTAEPASPAATTTPPAAEPPDDPPDTTSPQPGAAADAPTTGTVPVDPPTPPTDVADPPSGETTRVIVELTTPIRPPAELAPAEQSAQQQAIAETQTEVAADLEGTGTEVAATFDNLPGMAVEATPEGLDELRSSPEVAAIRVDGVARPLLNVSTELVRADEAWATADGTGYSVAVLDTGVDGGHDFLDDSTIVHEACFADDVVPGNAPAGDCPDGQNTQTGPGAAAPCPFAGCDHGTHVAGIVASDGDPGSNGVSYPGVARGAGIVAEQVFHNSNGSALAYFSDIVEALDDVYAIRDIHSVAAVNMSLGGAAFSGFCDGQVEPLMFQAVQNLKDEGVATVVAAGNTGSTGQLSFPSCLSNVISVSSVDTATDLVSGTANSAFFLRLLAPGAPVTSSMPDSSVPRNDVGSKNGTSMAAPHVAGAIAVLRQAGVGAGVADLDLVDHLHGVLRAASPCVTGPSGVRFARVDVKAAIDFTSIPSALFWDVDCGVWFEDAVDWLGFDPDGALGPVQPLATGYPGGWFGGDLPITRGQDARMLYRLFGEPDPSGHTHGFVDVGEWIRTAVNWLSWPGGPSAPDPLMTGYGSLFKSNDNITRAEKARQLHRAAGSPDPASRGCPAHGFSDVPPWVEVAVRWIRCPAFGPGGVTPIATGYLDGTFRPDNPIIRAEAARMLQRFNDAGYVV